MVAVFLKFELDLNLGSNKLDLGLDLELARGQILGAPVVSNGTTAEYPSATGRGVPLDHESVAMSYISVVEM